MEKKAVVTLANWSSEYDFNGKHLFVHAISFDNKDAGEYHSISQTQTKFIVGQEAEYTLLVSDRGNRIKPVSTFVQNSGDNENPKRQESIQRQTALKIASECVDINKHGIDSLFAVADKFAAWLDGKQEPVVQTPQQPTDIDTTKAVDANQMPF